ncbi:unnamed protein product, partial [Symbiodinium pilosum]
MAEASAGAKSEPEAPAKEEQDSQETEWEQFQKWKKAQQEAKEKEKEKSRSPPKKTKTAEDDPEFIAKLQSMGIQIDDLDMQLRHQLRTSEQAREDFLAVHQRGALTTYNPDTGIFQAEQPARKRDFATSSADNVEIEQSLEPRIKEAMLSYHQNSVLPNVNKLFQQCDMFYQQVSIETAMQQFQNERFSAQLQSLEQSRANKTVLLYDLPPFTNRSTLEGNVSYVLDSRFPRRYACLLFLDDQHYEDVLQKWHAAFSDRMRRTIHGQDDNIEELYDKSFDLSNNQAKLANFPYP